MNVYWLILQNIPILALANQNRYVWNWLVIGQGVSMQNIVLSTV